MVLDANTPETEKSKLSGFQLQVKSWFGSIAYKACRKQYETGRKQKRTLLWKTQDQKDKELKTKKVNKRKQDKRLARLRTLHWLIEQQFEPGGVTLKSQLNTSSANNLNVVKMCVALNSIFTHKKGEEKFSLSLLLQRLADKLHHIEVTDPMYHSANSLYRTLLTECDNIKKKAIEYANESEGGATAITKDGWNIAESFEPDVV